MTVSRNEFCDRVVECARKRVKKQPRQPAWGAVIVATAKQIRHEGKATDAQEHVLNLFQDTPGIPPVAWNLLLALRCLHNLGGAIDPFALRCLVTAETCR